MRRQLHRLRLHPLHAPAPMIPGLAIKQIHQRIGGRLLAVGQIKWSDNSGLKFCAFLYLKARHGIGEVVESVWRDDGVAVRCVARTHRDRWFWRTETGWNLIERSAVHETN